MKTFKRAKQGEAVAFWSFVDRVTDRVLAAPDIQRLGARDMSSSRGDKPGTESRTGSGSVVTSRIRKTSGSR